ncbi:hypothetical protein BC826DRAFT_1181227 [Russula brevipes]|nr:hypothetical protein BC826DRAFT_1181227 [Russula brevipes]
MPGRHAADTPSCSQTCGGYMTTSATTRLRPLALANVWGGTYDDVRPPRRRHPLMLANAWGVYDNVCHHATPTPRTRKRVGGTYDNARPPRRRHPLALANVYGTVIKIVNGSFSEE